MGRLIHWCDVAPHLAKGMQPVFMLSRAPVRTGSARASGYSTATIACTGDYYVPVTDLLASEVKWALTSSGSLVRVPLFGYTTSVRALSAILGSGLELGLQAMESFRAFSTVEIAHLDLVLGTECIDLGTSFRCFVGLAVRATKPN